MRLLLYTRAIHWLVADGPRLSTAARHAPVDPAGAVLASSVSAGRSRPGTAWGVCLCPSRRTGSGPRLREAHGIASLDLAEAATLTEARRAPLHRSPFDRPIVCRAITAGLVIVTPDPAIQRAPLRVL